MDISDQSIISKKALDYISKKYGGVDVTAVPVTGGYTRNRRAIVQVGDLSFFAKEVDTELLPGDGVEELLWQKKEHDVAKAIREFIPAVVPEQVELLMDGHLLLMPSYTKEAGWWWSLPADKVVRTAYINKVIQTTRQLETLSLPDHLIEELSLQPFFRDELAYNDGIGPILKSTDLHQQIIDKYSSLLQAKKPPHLLLAFQKAIEALQNDALLTDIKNKTIELAEQPNDYFNHCDVRSDNLAYNEHTGEIKFVDWNWASYTPSKFGTTEFLVDVARSGVDISPWMDELNLQLLAAMVGYYMVRSLKDPFSPTSRLRDMQAETAAVSLSLYEQMRNKPS